MISILSKRSGKTVAYLSDALKKRQIPVTVMTADTPVLKSETKNLIRISKVMIYVGDCAEYKSLFAETFRLPMLQDAVAAENLRTFCLRTKTPFPNARKTEAMCALPEGFRHFINLFTLQCAAYGEHSKCAVYILPDDVREADHIYTNYIDKLCDALYGVCEKRVYKIFALTEEEILAAVKENYNEKYVSMHCDTDEYLDSTLTLTLKPDAPEKALKSADKNVCEALSASMYAHKKISLAACVVQALKEINKRVAVAESLTGGLIADKIVEVEGASKVFYEGLVTYSVASKCKRLGINPHLVDKHGVVSSEVAAKMAAGLLNGDVEFSLATTGYAGPTADNGQPVGLCYTAVGSPKGVQVYRNVFVGDRNTIRTQAALHALHLLLNEIKNQI